MKDGLNNKQFVIIALVIMLSGIAIFSHDYISRKKTIAIENMSVVFEENTGPEVVESVETPTDVAALDSNNPTLDQNNGINNSNVTLDQNSSNVTSNNATTAVNDPSGRVRKQSNKKTNYIGRIRIPSIGLNKGFVLAPTGKKGLNCVDQNVCAYRISGNIYPDQDSSHLILGAHNGSGWNAFFTRIDKLKNGSYAYIEYKGKIYKYKMVDSYQDGKGDYAISFKSNGENKQLSLFTCARPNYNRYYLVLSFKLVAEENM